jgi:hypothetical protein
MADNFLITGYWGEPHVTAENDRGIHAAIFGAGRKVLPVGQQFRAEYIGNSTVRMYDGKLINNGAAAGIPAGQFVDLVISEASQGKYRNDLIIFKYVQDTSTLIESGTFEVLKGTEVSGTPTDPALTQSDLLSGNAIYDEMALWRVSVSGATISAPVPLFDVFTIEMPKSTMVNMTVSAWSNTVTITNANITPTSPVELMPGDGITAEQLKALQKANIIGGTQTTGSIQLKIMGTVPSISIPIKLIIRGDM